MLYFRQGEGRASVFHIAVFGDSIAELSAAQESHAKLSAQVKAAAAAKAEEERAKEKEKEIKTIEGRGGGGGGGAGKSANGTTTYR